MKYLVFGNIDKTSSKTFSQNLNKKKGEYANYQQQN